MSTQASIQAVVNQLPELNMSGVGITREPSRSAEDVKKQQAQWQADLLASTERFEQVCAWLEPLKTIHEGSHLLRRPSIAKPASRASRTKR